MIRSLPVEKTEMLWIEGESDDRACPVRDGNALSDPLGAGSLLGDIMNSFKMVGEDSVEKKINHRLLTLPSLVIWRKR